MKTNNKKNALVMCECAIMIALAAVLSFVKILELPYGGSVTAFSIVPIVIISYRHGVKWGLLSGFVFSIIQLIQTASTLSYATSFLAAVTIIRDEMPEIKIRVVNVVDLFKLESDHKHPHGLSDDEYDAIFTKDKPIIFAFHGYPTLVHELTYERHNRNLSVHGYQEEGTITTPFDMRVQNQIDRFNLVKDAIMHLPQLGNRGSFLIQKMNDKLVEHKQYIAEYGQDLEEIRNWEWHK